MKQTPIDLARKHVGQGAAMDSSARACLAEAIKFRDEGKLRVADMLAINSLSYSIGFLGGDYQKAWRMVFGEDRPVGNVTASDRLAAWQADEKALCVA